MKKARNERNTVSVKVALPVSPVDPWPVLELWKSLQFAADEIAAGELPPEDHRPVIVESLKALAAAVAGDPRLRKKERAHDPARWAALLVRENNWPDKKAISETIKLLRRPQTREEHERVRVALHRHRTRIAPQPVQNKRVKRTRKDSKRR